MFSYPPVRRAQDSETFFGTEVHDPYRWLEDPDSEETKEFVTSQNKLTIPFIENCEYRSKIKSRLTELYDFPKYGCPSKHGSKYFYSMNTGLQNQSVIYVQDSLQDEPKVFFDPNTLSDDGTVAIKTKAWSESGKIFGYGLSSSGSDWFDIKFINVEDGKELPDVIEKAKFSSIAWTHDDKGIFYSRYPNADVTTDGTETLSNENRMLYYHRLGTKQSEDVLCIAFPEHPKWNQNCEVSDCGKYLVTSVEEGCSKTVCLYVTDLEALENGIQENLPLLPIFENQEEDSDFEYVTNNGTIFTFRTNSEASNWKLINIDITNPSRENWTALIDEHKTDVLEWATCVNNNFLFVCYMRDVKHELQLHKLDSGNKVLDFPLDIGSITGFSGKKKSPEVFREIKLSKFDVSSFKVTQVFYPSKDGTKIPMFVIHSQTILVCYMVMEALIVSITPYFSMNRLLFIDNLKGIYAIANIRGGGLIIQGGSNGGLLVGACMNQYPDLFGCAIAHVGVMDMLRFHKFTIGHAWCTDFGCAEEEKYFEYMHKEMFSILPTLLLTADHDDRVVPLHSLKFIAEAQHTLGCQAKQVSFRKISLNLKCPNPIMIRIETKAGHGGGKPTSKSIDEYTDIYCFIIKTLGLHYKE
ncbi:Prolyl endopeptidase [Nymphon striatum]|nr:Prolyl endopeptidase [Nymphon striatum]